MPYAPTGESVAAAQATATRAATADTAAHLMTLLASVQENRP